MKIRAMENIPTGFTFPVNGAPAVYKGKPLKCGEITDVDEKDAEPIIAAGIAEPAEKKAVAETSGLFGKKG